MSLAPGVRLGPYEVLSAIGAGGMGEVYRARDPRLGRDVAIKVLPAGFSADPDRLRRFELEARAAAALNHPNIVVVYDVNTQDGVPYVVSELLEGETLDERIRNGPIDTDTAIRFAVQIADALDAVHRAGIVHGDLKPSNVIVTKTGVKLVDFGLATESHGESAGRRFGIRGLSSDTASVSVEPKLIGSLPYMAPEQLDGRPTDARTDLYAFGIVLYEMLTGRRMFNGLSAGATIAAILSAGPRATPETRSDIPSALERVVSTCLARDPDERWQSARDLKRELQWAQADRGRTETANRHSDEPDRWFPGKTRASWILASLVAMVTAAGVIVFETRARHSVNPTGPIRLVIHPPSGTQFSPSASLVSVSPDGRQIAFLVLADGVNHIWIRPLDSVEARELRGTGNALGPFWSPDSRSLGFFDRDRNELKIVDVAGGQVQRLCDYQGSGPAGTWNREGVILFATGSQNRVGISRVSASGGGATAVRIVPEGDHGGQFMTPEFLPNGRDFIYRHVTLNPPTSDLFVGSLDSSKDRLLVSRASNAVYTPPGYLVFRSGDTLFAQPLDPTTVTLTGPAVAIAHDVGYNPYPGGRTMFSVSQDTLAYRPQTSRQLVWFDRSGRREGTVTTTWSALNPSLSPDGLRLAVTRRDAATGTADVWVMDLRRGVSVWLSPSSGNSNMPIWSPDGQHVLFGSNRGGQQTVFETDASGAGIASPIAEPGSPRDWSRDGTILYAKPPKFIAVAVPRAGAGKRLELPFTAPGGATFSPDGHWIAYSSNESGQDQVFIRSFPGGEHPSRVSSAGGTEPRWRRDGQELYYLASDGHIVATSITTHQDTLEIGPPRPLFATHATGVTLGILGGSQYAVTNDGQRFLVSEPVEQEANTPLIVVVNWRAALSR